MQAMEIDGESPGGAAAADRRPTKPRKKNRSPSPTTIRRDFAGGMVAETTTTITGGAWTGGKKAKIQEGAPTTDGADDMTAAPVINTEQPETEQGGFDWKQVEGFDWTEADVKEEADSFFRYFGIPDEDDDFWYFCDDQQTEELNRRLAMYHIRAHKGAELTDAQLSSMLEEDGYFQRYQERDPEWYFNRKRCRIVGFQDYQRLALYDESYTDWDYYHEACSTLESDQQFVRLWEKLLDKTKWLKHYYKLTPQEREIMERVVYYHAVKIRADFPLIYSKLLGLFLEDYFYSVKYDHFYARLYFGTWKRVAKQQMNFKDAFEEVKDEAMQYCCWVPVEIALKRDKYMTYVAGIDKNLEEGEAYWLIVEAVQKFVPRLKTYYEYAKKKLAIAEKMGLIPSTPTLALLEHDRTF